MVSKVFKLLKTRIPEETKGNISKMVTTDYVDDGHKRNLMERFGDAFGSSRFRLKTLFRAEEIPITQLESAGLL